jgi:pyruvate/oxaloacetate carboxyltransferase
VAGKRYKFILNETKELLRGGYGETPGPVNRELQKKALKGQSAISCRPADLIPNGMDRLQRQLKGITESEEDILSYALFPHIALEYLKNK